MKIICENRQAYHEYFIDEKYVCGIVLEGAEVKSIRKGNISLKDSFCSLDNGEVFINNMHIAVYDKAGAFNNRDSKRRRKILLNRFEINKIVGKVNQKGYTLVPIKAYFEGSLVKIEMGLCRGKHTFDKKESLKQKDIEMSVKKQLKEIR